MKRSMDKCVFHCRQSNVRRVLPAYDYCQTLFRCAQWFDHSSLGSSRKLGGAAKHLIDGSEKCICQLSYEFYCPCVIERRSKLIRFVCITKTSHFNVLACNLLSKLIKLWASCGHGCQSQKHKLLSIQFVLCLFFLKKINPQVCETESGVLH